jgi:hypothetical protein
MLTHCSAVSASGAGPFLPHILSDKLIEYRFPDRLANDTREGILDPNFEIGVSEDQRSALKRLVGDIPKLQFFEPKLGNWWFVWAHIAIALTNAQTATAIGIANLETGERLVESMFLTLLPNRLCVLALALAKGRHIGT